MSAQGIQAQGVNPLVSANLYSKVIVPIALYGFEFLEQTHKCKCYSYFPFPKQSGQTITRATYLYTLRHDGMNIGLNRLPSIVESRKFMFLHKLISLPAGSVSRELFIRKHVLFMNKKTFVTLGFVCDICLLLLKYNLHAIINNLLSSSPNVKLNGRH